MLSRAESRWQVRTFCHIFILFKVIVSLLHQAVNEFILSIGAKETTADKRRKTSDLVLDEEEWTRVRLFCNILQVRVQLVYL